MQEQNTQNVELIARITKLESIVDNLTQQFFKNNFSSSQTFNKDAVFTTRLKLPVYTVAPSVGEVGDVISFTDGSGAGQMYICTVAGTVATPATFTKVGTQV